MQTDYSNKIALFYPSRSVIAALIITLFLTFTAVPYWGTKVLAGDLTLASLTISDSRAAKTGVTYTFAFTLTGNTAVKQWTIKFCTSADTSSSCTTPTGMDTTTAVLSSDNFSAGGGGRTNTFTSNGILTTVVTTPAANEATLAKTVSYTTIKNQTTPNASFYGWIYTYSDSGSTIIDGPTAVAAATLDTNSLAASATVDASLTFTVTGDSSSTTVAGNQSSDVATTATTIPFGVLIPGTTKTAATDITVTTNAANGYTVTVKSADPPLADGSKNIDKFSAGSNASPATWVGGTTNNPTGTTASVNTGFFGYTTSDSTLGTGTAGRFTVANNLWAGSDLQTASEVAYGPGTTSGTGDTIRLGWRVEVDSYQPQGSYTGTITLVATPTF